METPNNIEGELTEKIMAKIERYLAKKEPPQENHNYNRVYEAIYSILQNSRKD